MENMKADNRHTKCEMLQIYVYTYSDSLKFVHKQKNYEKSFHAKGRSIPFEFILYISLFKICRKVKKRKTHTHTDTRFDKKNQQQQLLRKCSLILWLSEKRSVSTEDISSRCKR